MKHRGQRWTNEEIDLAKQLYEEGKTIDEISTLVNHSNSAINHKLQAIGIQKTKRVDWTEEDCKKLKELFDKNLSYSEIGKILGKTTRACQGRAIRLGLKKKECNVWKNRTREDFYTDSDIKLLKELIANGCSCKEIASELNRSEKSIFNKMKENGLHILKKTQLQESAYRRVYTVDDNYFENIDSQKKAYWLGWMITDGYVMELIHTKRGDVKSSKVGLKLNKNDVDVIKDITKDTNSTFPIKYHAASKNVKPYINKITGETNIIKGDAQYYFEVTSAKMVQDLKKYGIHQNITYDVVFPELLDEKYYPGFIAGVISGDGSVNIKDNHHTGKLIRVNIAGTYSLLEGIKKVLIENINFNPEKKITRCKSSQSLYSIELNQTETFALSEWFDKNDIKLMERKDKILKEYIAEYKSI